MASSTYPTLREIRDAHTWKRDYERYLPLSRYFFRPIGFLLTWLAIRIGLTSETVSWISGFVGLIGCLCLLGSRQQLLPIGIGFLIFFNLIDCVDGSIARTMKTENPYGRFLDSLMAWIDMGFWALIGVVAYHHSQLLLCPKPFDKGEIVWLAIGGLTCYLSILIGYIESIFDNLLRKDQDRISIKPESDTLIENVTGKMSASLSLIPNIIRRINHNLRVRETHYFLLVFASLCKVIDLLLGFFLVYYFVYTISLIIIYSIRGRHIRLKYYV